MTWIGSTATSRTADRVDWVDYAKGLCIVLVVMMHSTLGVEQAAGREGFMHALVAFAKPFRMPDFFLIAGLFLARVIDRDWRSYLDRKLVPFAYFYVLWMTIQVALKAPLIAQEQGWSAVAVVYLVSFVEPFGTLWFIYLLPIYFVVTKLARGLPPALVWLAAAALELAERGGRSRPRRRVVGRNAGGEIGDERGLPGDFSGQFRVCRLKCGDAIRLDSELGRGGWSHSTLTLRA